MQNERFSGYSTDKRLDANWCFQFASIIIPCWWWHANMANLVVTNNCPLNVMWILCFYSYWTTKLQLYCIVLYWWLNNFWKQNNVEIVSRMFVFVCNCCFNILFASSVNRNFFAHNSPMGPTLQPTSIAMELHFFFILLSFSVFLFFVFIHSLFSMFHLTGIVSSDENPLIFHFQIHLISNNLTFGLSRTLFLFYLTVLYCFQHGNNICLVCEC